MRWYEYKVMDKDQYKVIRVDDKYPKGDKRRYIEYDIDLRNGDALCSCKSFYFKKKLCKHCRFILNQLAEGGGILDFQNKPHQEVKSYRPIKKRTKKPNIELNDEELLK